MDSIGKLGHACFRIVCAAIKVDKNGYGHITGRLDCNRVVEFVADARSFVVGAEENCRAVYTGRGVRDNPPIPNAIGKNPSQCKQQKGKNEERICCDEEREKCGCTQ